ncbi:MAG: hypothetical protein AVDCRST_MAG33-2688 [uncultured Thermomicrobiales bacterium]|uniref:Inositolphosphotransferase Aur1/Ipt1 domain-containing protein n=1 Tax=uncultured Thermomicrobiales bacterium TaxID=1645740 RepID=A0A6J4VB95_9BACT|nr:MAG: hypothetical protein AVDCRST_MAG33-2688 [uncultured Thermomicrobiales bacterium]
MTQPGPERFTPQLDRTPTEVVEPVSDIIVDAGQAVTGVPSSADVASGRFNLSRQFLIRIVIAAAIVVTALLTNRSFLGWGLFAVLAVLFMPIDRFRSFILAFVPYGAIWAIFSFLRSFADETPLAQLVNLRVLHFERWLFDGQIPTITWQSRFFDRESLQWWDYYLTFVHWSYFIVPHVLAFQLWRKHPDVFRRFLAALTILLSVGLAIYFLIPTNPPWLSDDSSTAAAPTVSRVMETVVDQLGRGIYDASYAVVGESNPIAAMPSIHMAITFLLIFPAGYFGRRWRLLAIFYSLSMGVALVYLGEHYVIDIVVGSAVASYGWWASGAWVRQIGPRVDAQLRSHRAAGRASSTNPPPSGASPGLNG